MKILVTIVCTEDYVPHASKVLEGFQSNILNPEGHIIDYKIQVIDCSNPFEYEDYIFMNQWHPGTTISLYRFRLFQNTKYDRIISLDSDMAIVGNVDLLLSSALNNLPFWACKDYGCPVYYKDRISEELKGKLFNGGLQVINKPLLKDSFLEELVPGESFDGSDQGYLLNYFIKKKITIGYLPDEYNYAIQDTYYPRIDNPRIIHYTGRKPWE